MATVDALIKFAVSEKSEEGAWGTLVREVANAHVEGGDIAEVLKNAEAEFKERTGSALPSRYRSAKSVILKAYEHRVPTMSENGEPLGKTSIEKAIKAAVPKNKPEPSDMVCDALDTIKKAYGLCVSEAERTALKTYVAINIDSCWE